MYLLAKVPRAGRVKTRLCPPLTPRRAARLAEAFTADLLTNLAAMAGRGDPHGSPRAEVRLALGGRPGETPSAGPSTAARRLEALASGLGIPVEGQGPGDLGARMRRLMARGLDQGRSTVLVGSDVPDLPVRLVGEALDALEEVDAVVSPAADGGYVLIGSRRPVPGMFEIEAPWGSSAVLAATQDALRRSGCSHRTVASWEDVDDAAALGRLASRLQGHEDRAASTARLLESWRRQGVRF